MATIPSLRQYPLPIKYIDFGLNLFNSICVLDRIYNLKQKRIDTAIQDSSDIMTLPTLYSMSV